MNKSNKEFLDVVGRVHEIGKSWHANSLIEHARDNKPFIAKSLKDLPAPASAEKSKSAIVVSAGPSLHKFDVLQTLKAREYQGSIVAVDGSMIKCLKNGIIPDYVLTLDPHPTRIVRWFGDHDFEKHSEEDDYFSRQDLDIEFRNDTIRENLRNIELVNKYASQIKLIICTSAPQNVRARALEAGFDCYWWNPIVDDPSQPGSMTRELFSINNLRCMNTGGTVGTAAWVFANSILKVENIGITGMDLGYHRETPIENTQTFYELNAMCDTKEQLQAMFPSFVYPSTGVTYYTDPTYYWYRNNLLGLLKQATSNTVNCSEAGILFGDGVDCMPLTQFLENYCDG
ncbi:6-hydroxymethylpterin diphosphokinase MptE-like protein [Planctobacterium marinum]|uniref:6-hydroxymethylpterin diphosphokinase MptE-like domain-containing protein n=1 Tax=Planctobacterium marinum TaxID=1631968 RepID=A0AA48I875_9ALTE|nr:hypothetical protein MACH26_32760 [Planctobacterium marinum]